MIDLSKQNIKQDAIPLSVGGGFLGFSTLAEAATFAEQIGMILGCALVAVTLLHRLYLFWKDSRRGNNDNR